MKIYDLISHRSYDIQADWIDVDHSKQNPNPILIFTKTGKRQEFHRIFLRGRFKKHSPYGVGILAVTKKNYINILNSI